MKNIYQSKLVSVQDAAAKIESGDRIWFGSSTSTPIQLMDAVVDRYAELTDVHIISSLFLYDFKVLQDAKYIGHIKGHSVFVVPQERLYHKIGNIDNNSVPFSKVCIALRDYYRVDTLAVDVSLPDEEGYLYYGACGVDWHGEIAEYAKKIIVQVNKYQPRIKGPECKIHVSKVDYICEADHSFPVFPQREPRKRISKSPPSHRSDSPTARAFTGIRRSGQRHRLPPGRKEEFVGSTPRCSRTP